MIVPFLPALGAMLAPAASFISGAIGSIITTANTVCATAGAGLVGDTLITIGTTLANVFNPLKALTNGLLTDFGGMVIDGAMSFLRGSLEIVTSTDLGSVLGPLVEELMTNFVNDIVHDVAETFGIFEKGEKTEHVGYRLEQAQKHANDWEQREDFSSFKNYYQYLKKQISEVDEHKIEKDERYYQLLGMAAEQQAIQEELGVKLPVDFLMEVGRSKMDSQEYLAFADVIGTYTWETVQGYLKNTLPVKEMDKISEVLLSALEQYCSGKSREDLNTRLSHICAASDNDKILATKNYHDELHEKYPEQLKEAKEKELLPEWYQDKGV